MPSVFHASLMALLLGSTSPIHGNEVVAPLSGREARAIIEAEMQAGADRERARRHELRSVPALHESEVSIGGNPILFRRIAPAGVPVSITKPEAVSGATRAASAGKEETPWPVIRAISLSVTIDEHGLSQIIWRGDHGKAYTVLSNVNFNYLRSLGTFTRNSIHWYLNASMENAGAALDQSLFTSDEPQYVVYAPGEARIPEALWEELDALHYHYLDNEAALKSLYYRNEALNQARREYLEKTPPRPKDTVINFWPVRSKAGTAETR